MSFFTAMGGRHGSPILTVIVILLVQLALLAHAADAATPRIIGIRVDKEPDDDRLRSSRSPNGIAIVDGYRYTLRLFTSNTENVSAIRLTTVWANYSADCSSFKWAAQVTFTRDSDVSGTIRVKVPEADFYYMCAKGGDGKFYHQGGERWMRFTVIPEANRYFLINFYVQVAVVVLFLCLSGLFSGLNLGLMSLDLMELQIVEAAGTVKEKDFARKIRPLRARGNQLLCTILLGNVVVNSTMTVLLDNLTGSGVYAILSSTLGIVIVGEIIPQAVCSRHGLAVGAHTIFITYFFMIVTVWIAWPISWVLDRILGKEIGNVYNRERLIELVKLSEEHGDFEKDETKIIAGALELKRKSVYEIMTPISDAYMIPFDAMLNFETVSEIMRQGYTRIPIFDGPRDNIVALLNIKDLALVDPDDSTPVQTLCKFYNHHVHFVLDDTTLDVMLETFKQGKTHMAFVQHIEQMTDRDPHYDTIGLVTLEDVIEEIIQAEIVDETDVLTDNRRRIRRREVSQRQDFSAFATDYASSLITPQLQLAVFQFLSTQIEGFKSDLITPNILYRLMSHPDIAVAYRMPQDPEARSNVQLIYSYGKPADYFVLILEGRVEAQCGREGIVFQTGPFGFFGIAALVLPPQDWQLYYDTEESRRPSGAHNPPQLPSAGGSPLGVPVSQNLGEGPTDTRISPSTSLSRTTRTIAPTRSDISADESRRTSMVPPRQGPDDSTPTAGASGSAGTFWPDYTVRPVTDLLYLRVHRAHYLAAFRASQYERRSDNYRSARAAAEMMKNDFDILAETRHTNEGGGGGGGNDLVTLATAADAPPQSFATPKLSMPSHNLVRRNRAARPRGGSDAMPLLPPSIARQTGTSDSVDGLDKRDGDIPLRSLNLRREASPNSEHDEGSRRAGPNRNRAKSPQPAAPSSAAKESDSPSLSRRMVQAARDVLPPFSGRAARSADDDTEAAQSQDTGHGSPRSDRVKFSDLPAGRDNDSASKPGKGAPAP